MGGSRPEKPGFYLMAMKNTGYKIFSSGSRDLSQGSTV